MLRKKLIPTPSSIPAAAAAGTCTIDLPIGLKYHTVGLNVSNSAGTALASLISEVRLKINGKTQRALTATQLGETNGLYGTQFANLVKGTGATTKTDFTFHLAEPWRKDIGQVSIPAWNVAGPNVRSFQAELDFLAVGGETAKSVAGYYEAEPATGALGTIAKVQRHSLSVSGTVQDVNLLGLLAPGDFLQSISLFKCSGAAVGVIKAQLIINGEIIHDLLEFWEQFYALTSREMVPDTTATNPRYDIVLDFDDPLTNAVRMQGVNEARLHLEFGTVNQTTGAVASSAASGSMPMIITAVGLAN